MKLKKWQVVGFYLTNTLLAIAFLAPILWTLMTSLKPTHQILTYPPRLLPERFTLEHYRTILSVNDAEFLRYVVNSLIVTSGTIFVVIVVSSLAGYAFAYLRFPGINVFFVAILATMMVPFQSLLIPLYGFMQKIGLLNSYFGLVLMYSTFQLPFCVFMMRNSFASLPPSLRESALLDGCTEAQVFRKIYLPLSLPGFATVLVYSFMTSWNEFLMALTFNSNVKVQTLQVGLTNYYLSRYRTSWEMITTGSIITMIPVLVVFFVLQRYYVRGLTSGAVK
ncbi:MAG: carbohydrate ABC transporter permease [Bacillota bacterium]|nr:carbohydrate ABC transporter permease [Bacillota bacterium]HHT91158.1 carbohydrate ABC transporter permease [Bacillota bacterium]